MKNRVEIGYKDVTAWIKPLSFKSALEFKEIQALTQNPLSSDPKMKDTLDLFEPYIKITKNSNNKEVPLDRLNMNAFRELCILTLSISIPEQAFQYSFMCENLEAPNYDKIANKNLLDILDSESETYEEDKRELEETIKGQADKIPCKNTVQGSIEYQELNIKVEKAINLEIKKVGKKYLQCLKVKHKIAFEEFLLKKDRHSRLYSLEDLPQDKPLEKLSRGTKKEETYIIFELVLVALHLTSYAELCENVDILVDRYNVLLDLDNVEILKLIKKVSEYEDKSLVHEVKCNACGMGYNIKISVENFSLVPT
jgi:hypothetical protein